MEMDTEFAADVVNDDVATLKSDRVMATAAQRYLQAYFQFKAETGLSPSKANELLGAIVVNRWLESNSYPWTIEISSKPRGVDGNIIGEFPGPRDVEFKSSTSKTASYQFDPNFAYDTHGCIVFIHLSTGGLPKQLILAFGERSIKSIKSLADADTGRANFDASKGDRALVHTTARRASDTRPRDVYGLLDLVADSPVNERNDRIVLIGGEQLETLLAVG